MHTNYSASLAYIMFFLKKKKKKGKKSPTPRALKQSWHEINFVNVKTSDWNFPGSLSALAAQIPLKTYHIHSGQITETADL